MVTGGDWWWVVVVVVVYVFAQFLLCVFPFFLLDFVIAAAISVTINC